MTLDRLAQGVQESDRALRQLSPQALAVLLQPANESARIRSSRFRKRAAGKLVRGGNRRIDELADSEDELERARALLNLHEYTACPSEVLKPLLSKGIESGTNRVMIAALEKRLA